MVFHNRTLLSFSFKNLFSINTDGRQCRQLWQNPHRARSRFHTRIVSVGRRFVYRERGKKGKKGKLQVFKLPNFVIG
jgi:hypothetical protein